MQSHQKLQPISQGELKLEWPPELSQIGEVAELIPPQQPATGVGVPPKGAVTFGEA